MKIISTNIAQLTKFIWRGKIQTTGIFKKPVNQAIYLATNDVVNDEVSDRVHHGGFYKACYIFSAEQYPYWKSLYPELDWGWGMFGENLTVSDFDENAVFLGDIFKVGEAVVQVSQYREPCYKLGYKFGTQKVLKQFIQHGYGGTYLSVIQEGHVSVNDNFELIERRQNKLSVAALFDLVYAGTKDQELLKIAVASEAIPPKKRKWFRSFEESIKI